jgi:hypothetical protein
MWTNTNPSCGTGFISEDHLVSVHQLTSTSVSEKKEEKGGNSDHFSRTLAHGRGLITTQTTYSDELGRIIKAR